MFNETEDSENIPPQSQPTSSTPKNLDVLLPKLGKTSTFLVYQSQLDNLRNYYETRISRYDGLEARYHSLREKHDEVLNQMSELQKSFAKVEKDRNELLVQLEKERKRESLKVQSPEKVEKDVVNIGVGDFDVFEEIFSEAKPEKKDVWTECNLFVAKDKVTANTLAAFQQVQDQLMKIRTFVSTFCSSEKEDDSSSASDQSGIVSNDRWSRNFKETEECINETFTNTVQSFRSLNNSLRSLNSVVEALTKTRRRLEKSKPDLAESCSGFEGCEDAQL